MNLSPSMTIDRNTRFQEGIILISGGHYFNSSSSNDGMPLRLNTVGYRPGLILVRALLVAPVRTRRDPEPRSKGRGEVSMAGEPTR